MTENTTSLWMNNQVIESYFARHIEVRDIYDIILIDEQDFGTYSIMQKVLGPERIRAVYCLDEEVTEYPDHENGEVVGIKKASQLIDVSNWEDFHPYVCSFRAPAFFHSILYPVLTNRYDCVRSLFGDLKSLKAYFEGCSELNVFQPVSKLFDYWMGDKIYGNKKIYAANFLAGKNVLEFGPLDGAMTAAMVQENPARLHTVDIHWENYAKLTIAKAAFNVDAMEVGLDDFHNMTRKRYGCYDTIYAHGVLYHSSNPIHILEQLSNMTDTLVVGTHTLPRNTYRSFERSYEWSGRTFDFLVSPEGNDTKGGPGLEQVFMCCEDYNFVMEKLGFEVEPVLKNPSDYDELFYVFIARREHS